MIKLKEMGCNCEHKKDNCSACEISDKWVSTIMEAFKNGLITAEQMNEALEAGLTVTETVVDNGGGNYTKTTQVIKGTPS